MGGEILGIKELSDAFKTLGRDMSRKVGLRMAASAAGVIKTQVKNNIRSRGLIQTKALLNNVAIKREKRVPADVIQYHVGIRHGRNLTKKQRANSKVLRVNKRGALKVVRQNDPFYWKYLEFGRKIVGRKSGDGVQLKNLYQQRLRNGRVVNRIATSNSEGLRNRRRSSNTSVRATPFLAPALMQKKQEAIAAMQKVIERDILKGRR